MALASNWTPGQAFAANGRKPRPYTTSRRHDPILGPKLEAAETMEDRRAQGASPFTSPTANASPASFTPPAPPPLPGGSRRTSSDAFRQSVARNNTQTQAKESAYAQHRNAGLPETDAAQLAHRAGRAARFPGSFRNTQQPAPSGNGALPGQARLPLDPSDPANQQNTRTSSSPNFLDSLARGRQERDARAGNFALNAAMDNLANGDTPTHLPGSGKARIVTADGKVHERYYTPAPVETHAQLGRRQMQTAERLLGRSEDTAVARGLDPLPRQLARNDDARADQYAALDERVGGANAERLAAQGRLYDAQGESELAMIEPNAAARASEAYKNFNDPADKIAEAAAAQAEAALRAQQRLTDDARQQAGKPVAAPTRDATLDGLRTLHSAMVKSGDKEGAAEVVKQMREHLATRNANAAPAPTPESGGFLDTLIGGAKRLFLPDTARQMPLDPEVAAIPPGERTITGTATESLREKGQRERDAALAAFGQVAPRFVGPGQPQQTTPIVPQREYPQPVHLPGTIGRQQRTGGFDALESATGIGLMPQPVPGGEFDGAPVRVSSPQEAAQLPPGTRFVGPDGKLRQVPLS